MYREQRCKPVYFSQGGNESWFNEPDEILFKVSSGWGARSDNQTFFEISTYGSTYGLNRPQARALATAIIEALDEPRVTKIVLPTPKALKKGECQTKETV